jgi:hypothetical protein
MKKKNIGLISESVKQRGLHACHSRSSRRFTHVSFPLRQLHQEMPSIQLEKQNALNKRKTFLHLIERKKEEGISGPDMALDLQKNVVSNHTNRQSLAACCTCHAHAQEEGLVWTALLTSKKG